MSLILLWLVAFHQMFIFPGLLAHAIISLSFHISSIFQIFSHLFRLVRYKCTRWPIVREDAVSACFDRTGQQLYVMHRILPPCLYDLWHEEAQLSFMDNTGSYKNIVTMKSGCFMGQNDEVMVVKSMSFLT